MLTNPSGKHKSKKIDKWDFPPQSKRNLSTETSKHSKHFQFCIITYGITKKVLFVNYITWNAEKTLIVESFSENNPNETVFVDQFFELCK